MLELCQAPISNHRDVNCASLNFAVCFYSLARRIWKDYFIAVNAIVFIIDAFDRDRFMEAKQELDVRFRFILLFCFGCDDLQAAYFLPILSCHSRPSLLFDMFRWHLMPSKLNNVAYSYLMWHRVSFLKARIWCTYISSRYVVEMNRFSLCF